MTTDSWTMNGVIKARPGVRGVPAVPGEGLYELTSDEALGPEVSSVREISRATRLWRARFLVRLIAVAVAICAATALVQSLVR